MRTRILCVATLFAVSNMAGADTFSNLLNDIPKNVSVVEQTGTCDTNGEIERKEKTQDGYTYTSSVFLEDGSACTSVVANCGKGKTILPSSSCEVAYSDGTKFVKYMQVEQESNDTDFFKGTQSCNVELPTYLSSKYQRLEGRTTRDVTIKATARCVKTPPNFVQSVQDTAKKLGITIK